MFISFNLHKLSIYIARKVIFFAGRVDCDEVSTYRYSMKRHWCTMPCYGHKKRPIGT